MAVPNLIIQETRPVCIRTCGYFNNPISTYLTVRFFPLRPTMEASSDREEAKSILIEFVKALARRQARIDFAEMPAPKTDKDPIQSRSAE